MFGPLEAGSWKLGAERYSYLSASIGSSRAARIAGYMPNAIPMVARKAEAEGE